MLGDIKVSLYNLHLVLLLARVDSSAIAQRHCLGDCMTFTIVSVLYQSH